MFALAFLLVCVPLYADTGTVSGDSKYNTDDLITMLLVVANVLAFVSGLVIGWRLSARPALDLMS